eukprot:GGOE01037148.1.p1 GENE.GGOE01037148.1~~GGOE01037148.1.p1  ORF type:complete len:412 (-),score=91.22 GGOE01037148.1:119-1354(-)
MTWQMRHERPLRSPESGGMDEWEDGAHPSHRRLLRFCFTIVILAVISIALSALLLGASDTTNAEEEFGSQDLYQDLELDGDQATDLEIKKQYRKLSMQYHPDLRPHDAEVRRKYMRIAKAYEVLGDRRKRKVYDLLGPQGLRDWLQQDQEVDNNPFHAFFGYVEPSRKSPDRRYTMTFPLRDFYTGQTKDLRFMKQRICRQCKGRGAHSKDDIQQCPQCHGHGVVVERHMLGPGFVQQLQAECPLCHGHGSWVKRPCPVCQGQRIMRSEQVLSVELEPGTPEGHSVVFEMEADESPGQVPGDVLVTVASERHPHFVRAGDDLKLGLRISLKDALAGFATSVEHLDGRQVDISQSMPTPPGHVQRLAGQGMPRHSNPGDFGDLLVTYTVDFPAELTDEQKSGLRTLLADVPH